MFSIIPGIHWSTEIIGTGNSMGIPGTCYDNIRGRVQFDVLAQLHDGLVVM